MLTNTVLNLVGISIAITPAKIEKISEPAMPGPQMVFGVASNMIIKNVGIAHKIVIRNLLLTGTLVRNLRSTFFEPDSILLETSEISNLPSQEA